MTAMKRLLIICAALMTVSGCAVNPVTGKTQFVTQGIGSDIRTGEQYYAPLQQSQGGVYDIDPELTQYVSNVGQRLADASQRLAVADGVQLPYEFVVLNNSVPNAWALPGGKIAVNRGLLTELNSEAELAAVLGHEIVHAAARHSAQQQARSILLQSAVIGAAVATGDSGYQDLAIGGAGIGAQLINQAYGRGAEFESDKYGMRYMSAAGYDPEGAVALQDTFVRLSEGRNTDWLSGLFASHPPSRQRVEENRKTAAQLKAAGGAGTEIGAERFAAAMARTREILPAYEAYDEGRKALADKDTRAAVGHAERAIGLFPGEANFYALRGDARLLDEEYEMAVTNYSSAIRRRENFFYYPLQRGLAYAELGNDAEARADLEASMRLLPTAPAHYALGKIAEKNGRMDEAIAHYREVAGGRGEVAGAAGTRLVRLDIRRNPAQYVARRCDADANGDLVVSVRNETPVPVTDIAVRVSYTGDDGRARQLERRVTGRLDPGEISSISTGIGPYTSASGCPAQVVAARVAE